MRTLAASALLLAAVGAGGYWWASPYVAMRALRAAADVGDTDRMAELMDQAAVAESLRAQLLARVPAPSTPAGALGAMLATSAAERALSGLATPQALRAIIARGAPLTPGHAQQRHEWAVERVSSTTAIAYPLEQRDLSPQARDRFVWRRSGVAEWRLAEIRLSGS